MQRGADPVERALARVVFTAVKHYATLHARALRRMDDARAFVEGLASEVLSVEERSQLATALYGRRSDYGPQGLFAWEERWYRNDLPAAPAKILLGGCGAGREAAVLAEWGHDVFACEPAHGLYLAARERLDRRARVWQLGYEDWLQTARHQKRSAEARALLAEAPYDAVILGWASLSHVLDDEVRQRLFQRLVQLCPRGPILFSFIQGGSRVENGRAHRWGAGLGQKLARSSTERGAWRRERLLPHAGFVRPLSPDEIRALADSVGRTALLHDRPGAAHCTFRAPRSDAAAEVDARLGVAE